MKTKLFFLSILALVSLNLNAQTSVPDDAFETYLETHDAAGNIVAVGDANSLGDGTDGNDLVTTSKINIITNLYLGFLNIEDLTGLQDFAVLEDFSYLGNNVNVTSLTLPALTNLKKIYLGNFPNLSAIDISNLSNLEDATLQGISALTAMNLSSNLNLKTVKIYSATNLATLNIVGLTALEDLTVNGSTIITSLDFSTLTGLKKLHVQDFSSLTSIDFSNLTALEDFSIGRLNAIASLDLTDLAGLKNLNLSDNTLLSSLNIATGATASIDYVQLNRNPLLTCVEVDTGIPLLGLSTWNQNNGSIFNEDCANPATYVPDDNFEVFLEANSMGNGIANDNKVTTSNINTVTTLDVSNQSISDLTGIQDFDALVELNATSNSLTSVFLEDNVNLEKISLNTNQLETIDVSNNTALKQLWLRENNLKNLDVSNNVALEWLVCSKNNIESLDLSVNINASFLELHTNNLSVLNLKNIANITISYLDTQLNPNLACIQVDDATYWTTTFGAQIDTTSSFNTNCNYPETAVTDAAFENYLETHDRDNNIVSLGDINSMGNGIANDAKVFTYRINTITTLDISNVGLADLTGLEDFRDLEIFGAYGGNPGLTTADFSNNTKLQRITFSFNSNATSVTFGNLPNVVYVQLGYNDITSVDISGLPNLEEFKEFENKLTTLDTSGNPNLKSLNITGQFSGGPATTIDVTTNLLLETLNATSLQLTDIDVSNNTALTGINVRGNQIKHLDFSTNNQLTTVVAADNLLESLNLNNGANSILLGSYGAGSSNFPFDIRNNPNLTCIEVSNVAYANANWTAIDSQHVFNTDCSATWTIMTSPATLAALLAITPSIDIDNSGDITLAEAAAYSGAIDLSNSGITDIDGLGAFTGITVLDISGNGITDISPISGLTLTSLTQRNSNNTKTVARTAAALQTLILSGNALETANLDGLPNLSMVDISNNPELITLSIKNGNNANITNFDVTNSPKLTCILVDDINANYLSSWMIDATADFAADAADCLGRVLSVNTETLEDYISLYPNPVNDILNIKLSNDITLKNIEIYNVIGKKVLVSKKEKIQLENLSKGIYILKVVTSKGIITKKIIKE